MENTGIMKPVPLRNFTSQWKQKNQDALKYAGDLTKESINKGLEEASSFMKDSDEGTSFEKVQDASLKWRLAQDSNNPNLLKKAQNEMIGHLSKENKDTYLKDAEPLQAYVDAKDEFDYKNNNYTTTKNLDTTPDEYVRALQRKLNEKGYTDKFGNKLKEDGIYGGKTAFALDELEKNIAKNYTNPTGYDPDDLEVVALDMNGEPFESHTFASANQYVALGNISSSAQSKINYVENISPNIIRETVQCAQEKGVNHINILKGYMYSKRASDRAEKYAKNHIKQYTEDNKLITWENEADAYRHFTWNYEMAEDIGYSQALKISSAHEISYLRLHNLIRNTNTGNVYDRKAFMTPQMLMDVWNNLKGVNAYAEFKGKPSYLFAFKELLKRGDLVFSKSQALEAYGFTQDDVTIEIVGNEPISGVWVYFNYKDGYITNIRKADN